MNDRFETVAREARVKVPVGACRFIASVARTDNEDEARAFIARVSAEFHDATHNAYAYVIGIGDKAIKRQSDDAEPAGTAGLPMLSAIENAGLTNVTVVGTRYFGGVKLGIGGLVRAYRLCAEAGLAEAGRVEMVKMSGFTVLTPYENLGTVMREIAAQGGTVLQVGYNEAGAVVTGEVPLSKLEALRLGIVDSTSGKASVQLEDEGMSVGNSMKEGKQA